MLGEFDNPGSSPQVLSEEHRPEIEHNLADFFLDPKALKELTPLDGPYSAWQDELSRLVRKERSEIIKKNEGQIEKYIGQLEGFAMIGLSLGVFPDDGKRSDILTPQMVSTVDLISTIGHSLTHHVTKKPIEGYSANVASRLLVMGLLRHRDYERPDEASQLINWLTPILTHPKTH